MSEEPDSLNQINEKRMARLPWPWHWLWLLREPMETGLSGWGKRHSWYVVYPDGNRTVNMPYGGAVNYASMMEGSYIVRAGREM